MQFFIFPVSLFNLPLRLAKLTPTFYNNKNNYIIGAFEDDDVIHVEGDVNPVRDIEIINEELRLKDEEQLLAALEKLGRTVLRGEKKDKQEYVNLMFA